MRDLIPDKNFHKKVPIGGVIDQKRNEKEIEDSWKMPQLPIYDEIHDNPPKDEEKKQERGVVEIQFQYL